MGITDMIKITGSLIFIIITILFLIDMYKLKKYTKDTYKEKPDVIDIENKLTNFLLYL